MKLTDSTPLRHAGTGLSGALVLLLTLFAPGAVRGQEPPYKNPALPVGERVRDLLSRMTLEEKFRQLFMVSGDLSDGEEKYRNGICGIQMSARGAGPAASAQMIERTFRGAARASAEKNNAAQRFFLEKTRLGIPIIPFDEALHGLVREGATAFPQAIALAATWDTALVADVSAAIAEETRSRGIRQVLSPVVNVATDPRWGRVEETYGEDPFLSSVMGAEFVSQFERRGVVTTPKHFVANHGDGGRDSYPVYWNERLLEETYLPPFRACVTLGGSRSVMSSYNSLDGRPCTADAWLLKKKLRDDWGFTGFVISDAGAVGGMNDLHRTSADYEESAKQAIENGLDVLLQTGIDQFSLFFDRALAHPYIAQEAVDDAVSRVLRVKFQLGLFDHPYVDPDSAGSVNDSPPHREVARRASRESIVLLKNQGGLLPLRSTIGSIAVIGPDAAAARLGGYSGPGVRNVSILEGIRERLGKSVRVIYEEGCAREDTDAYAVPHAYLRCTSGGKETAGLRAEYWTGIDFRGMPARERVDPGIRFDWSLFPPDPAIPRDWFSARWTGELIAPVTGKLSVGLEGNDGFRLTLGDSLRIDNREKGSYHRTMRAIDVVQGRSYPLSIEYRETRGFGRLKLLWDYGVSHERRERFDAAVKAAASSDVTVFVAGIVEGEATDRASLALPGRQAELIRAIAATGKPVVVILVAGSPVTMSDWLGGANAVLDAWYPGEEGGHAVAGVLFGDYNPAGRLPVTFPLDVGQVPLIYNHRPTGRLDYYHDMPGEPLFPFGYGLSYTTFDYGNLRLGKSSVGADDSAVVRFTLTNTGARGGDEVVQLYVERPVTVVSSPVIELKGFQRVHLDRGKSRDVAFTVTREMLSMLDESLRPVTPGGSYGILIGSSSEDIRLRAPVTVESR